MMESDNQTWEDFDIEKGIKIAREKEAKNLTEELARLKEQYPQLNLNVEVKDQTEINPLDVIW